MDWSLIDYFKPEEFDDPLVPGSNKYMSPATILSLENLRDFTGWPIITHNKFGLRGCVCVDPDGHSENSYHYVSHEKGCSAVDWHFACDADPREQAMMVLQSGFTGIGIYYDWSWNGKSLPAGFHTDFRDHPQIWKRENDKCVYLLK